MIATQTQQSPEDSLSTVFDHEDAATNKEPRIGDLSTHLPATPLVLPKTITHSKKAGLNPLVDHASLLFSVLSELKNTSSYRQLNKLQKELIQEITVFHEAISHHGYNPEYLIVCRYILCATFDDMIINTTWGAQWDNYYLLAAFNQDTHHQDKFFTILERAIKEPAVYIDLMEFIYMCLCLGYKGQYRTTEYNQYQLEQITHNLYKHIRAHRGSFSKSLSPVPLKSLKPAVKIIPQSNTSLLFVSIVTACIIMTIFISLDYLMDVISNEAYKNITQIKADVSHETVRQ